MVRKIVQPPNEVARADIVSGRHGGFPDAGAWCGNVVGQMRRLHHARRRLAVGGDARDLAFQHAVVPQDVADSFEGVPHAARSAPFGVAELAAERDLAFVLGFIGQ